MAYEEYDNTNSGLLARNARKEKEDQPDFSGSINVEGVEYWLSGWIKIGKEGKKLAGQKFFSLAVTRKDEPQSSRAPSRPAARPSAPQRQAQAPAPAPQRRGSGFDDMKDDIPF